MFVSVSDQAKLVHLVEILKGFLTEFVDNFEIGSVLQSIFHAFQKRRTQLQGDMLIKQKLFFILHTLDWQVQMTAA